MPFISLRTNLALSADQKEVLKSKFGQLISIIPGKQEQGLMVELLGDVSLYKAGDGETPCAMVDMRCFKTAEYQDNRAFVQAVFKMLEEELALDPARVYMNLVELPVWGARGDFNQ